MEIQTKVYSGMWIRLPNEIKSRIAELFKIEKTTATHVMDGTIIADGYTEEELAKLNVESLQAFLGSEETDLFKLFNMLIEGIKTELAPKPKAVEEEKPRTEVNIKIEDGEVQVESKKIGKVKNK